MIDKHASDGGTSEFLTWIKGRLRQGLQLLKASHEYTNYDRAEDPRYAVELPALREAGIDVCDVRWLISQSYLEHLTEITLPGDQERSFRESSAIFGENSCFVLTESGAEFAQSLLGRSKESITSGENGVRNENSLHGFAPELGRDADQNQTEIVRVPMWDAERQELWFSEQIIKRFRIPSPNQVCVLSAFEEEGWPSRIDDPLPPRSEHCPKRRLQDTIRNLNRSHRQNTLRFVGDGSGEGILWEIV